MALPVDVNVVTMGDLWGAGAGTGSTLDEYATNATGPSSILATPGSGAAPASVMSAGNTTGGVLGHPLVWWAVVAGAIGSLWLLFQHVGPPEERRNFANMELSIVNVLLLSLVPLVGIPLWKTVLTAAPVPQGVKTFVSAA